MQIKQLPAAIPYFATLFMVSVLGFVILGLLQRPEFLVAAIPILIIIILATLIALWRSYLQSPEQSTN